MMMDIFGWMDSWWYMMRRGIYAGFWTNPFFLGSIRDEFSKIDHATIEDYRRWRREVDKVIESLKKRDIV